MRHAILIAAVAAAIAVPAAAQPRSTEFSSQGVTVDVPGVDLRIGPQRERERERWRERDVRGECKTVTVQERAPDGSMVTRTRSNC